MTSLIHKLRNVSRTLMEQEIPGFTLHRSEYSRWSTPRDSE